MYCRLNGFSICPDLVCASCADFRASWVPLRRVQNRPCASSDGPPDLSCAPRAPRGPFGAILAAPERSRSLQNHVKNMLFSCFVQLRACSPTTPQEPPRGPQEASRSRLHDPKRRPEVTQRLPRGPPTSPQEAPRSGPEAPKRPPEAP